jgi:hypothetical protein
MGRLPKLQPAPEDGGGTRQEDDRAAPLGCHPRASGDPEAAATTPLTERLDLDARVRGHDTESPVSCAAGAGDRDAEASPCATAAGNESDFVTGFAAQTLEIMGSLPKLQPAPEDRERPSSRAASGGAPQDEESCETGAEAAAPPQAPGDDPDPFIPAIYRRNRVRMTLNGVMVAG